MARVTVEDCLENIDNRFKLVLLGSKRARQLAMGSEPTLEWENDKPTVMAFREIAEGTITEAIMDEPAVDEYEETLEDFMAAETAANAEPVEKPAGPQED